MHFKVSHTESAVCLTARVDHICIPRQLAVITLALPDDHTVLLDLPVVPLCACHGLYRERIRPFEVDPLVVLWVQETCGWRRHRRARRCWSWGGVCARGTARG